MKIILCVGLFFSQFTFADAFSLMLESGAIWQNRNDVRIPPPSGTYVELDQFKKGPFFHYRTELYLRLAEKHFLRAVYAPFSVSVTGKKDTPVVFNNTTFQANQPLTVNYTFNSYRLSYAYRAWNQGESYIDFGFTAKIRQAEIRFRQTSTDVYQNTGFVPLLYFAYNQDLGGQWALNFTTDAAAARQGRAIDAALKIRRQLSPTSTLGLGWRTLEGGADNEKVFTFSWFNYAVIDYVVNF